VGRGLNERLDRWGAEKLDDLVAIVVWAPADQLLWALVIHDPDLERDIVLLTNLSIRSSLDARTVYTTWRHRPQIEHTYHFDQEDGLQIEDIQVRTVERMRRVFILVLLAALFVHFVD
jgi:hypothetical protein